MELKILKPCLSLNKAFLKVKPNRSDIKLFKKNLISLITTIDEFELKEFHKNEVSTFLQNTYYSGKHYQDPIDQYGDYVQFKMLILMEAMREELEYD
jgi:hypothetical protein